MGHGCREKSLGAIDEVLCKVHVLIQCRLIYLFGCRHLNDTEVGGFVSLAVSVLPVPLRELRCPPRPRKAWLCSAQADFSAAAQHGDHPMMLIITCHFCQVGFFVGLLGFGGVFHFKASDANYQFSGFIMSTRAWVLRPGHIPSFLVIMTVWIWSDLTPCWSWEL